MKNRYIRQVLLLLCLFPFAGWTQTTITVSPDKTFQAIDGIGGGIVYYLDWLTTHKNKEVLYDTLFNGLGLSSLRMGNWAQEEDADLSYDAEIYKAAKERLGDKCHLQIAAWSAPASLKANNSLSGTNGGTLATLRKENGTFVYDKYGQWWKRAIEQYRQVGVYPDYISLQNEPDCDVDYECTLLDSTSSTKALYGSALNSVYNYISTLDDAPKILGPEVIGIGWQRVQGYVNHCNSDYLAGYSFHYYHSGQNLHDAIELRYSYPDDFLWKMTELSDDYYGKKPMYMTENSSLVDYHQELDPINTAIFLSYAFSVNHVACYCHWNLIWGDEGDGCINLEFSENGYTTEDGYTINGDYHALRHYSKFIQKGWVNIDAQTTNSDVIVSAFKSTTENAYTVVIVNRSDKAQYIKLPFFPEGTEATVIRSSVKENTWSKTLGTYASLPDLYPPAYSITTINYLPKPQRYIYTTEESDSWTNAEKWSDQTIPTSIDTTFIRKGECKVSGLQQTAPVFVEQEGTLRLTGNSTFSQLHLQGGKLKSYTSTPLLTLQADLYIDEESNIQIGSSSSTFQINGRIYGEHDFKKTSDGTLDIHADASNFSGYWTVEEGVLQINNRTALGQNGAFINKGGTLAIATDATTENLILADSSFLILDASLSVKYAQLGSLILPGGTYTASDYPDFISRNGKLIVDRPNPILTKHGAGPSKQSIALGDSIIDFSYAWENAESVTVIWNPEQPEGLDVFIDDDSQYVFFSGEPTKVGIYRYTVATQSGSNNEAKKTGILSVIDETVQTKEVGKQTNSLSACIEKGVLLANIQTEKEEHTHLLLVNMKGEILADKSVFLTPGSHSVEVSKKPTQGTYLLQKRSKSGLTSLKVIVP